MNVESENNIHHDSWQKSGNTVSVTISMNSIWLQRYQSTTDHREKQRKDRIEENMKRLQQKIKEETAERKSGEE